MKKLIVALALTAGACAAPAFAGDVGFAISLGEPGFFGQLVIGNADRPALIDARPVIVARGYDRVAPIYLRVPDVQRRDWRRYCGRYDACSRPVYFVRDDWYRNDYAPRWQREHRRDSYRGDEWRGDEWRGERDGRRDWQGGDHRADRYGRNDYSRNDRGQDRNQGHDRDHGQGNGRHDRDHDHDHDHDHNDWH